MRLQVKLPELGPRHVLVYGRRQLSHGSQMNGCERCSPESTGVGSSQNAATHTRLGNISQKSPPVVRLAGLLLRMNYQLREKPVILRWGAFLKVEFLTYSR